MGIDTDTATGASPVTGTGTTAGANPSSTLHSLTLFVSEPVSVLKNRGTGVGTELKYLVKARHQF